MPINITNSSNIIGERQHSEKFVPLCIRKILNDETMMIHSNPEQTKAGTRYYLHARNIAKALQIIIESNTELQGTLSSLPVGKELLPEVVPVLSELIGNVLADHEGVSNIYEALKRVTLNDTDDKMREAKTISEVSDLDKQGGAKKLAIIKQ